MTKQTILSWTRRPGFISHFCRKNFSHNEQPHLFTYFVQLDCLVRDPVVVLERHLLDGYTRVAAS